MQLHVNFDVGTDPNTDQILAQIAGSRRPTRSFRPTCIQFGVTVQKSYSSPLMLFSLYSPKGAYDETFLANYAYINMKDPMTRVPRRRQRAGFRRGQYAMRFWVKPDQLAKLGITVPEIINAIAGAEHGEPGRPDRRRAGAEGPGVHLCRPRARTSRDARAIRRDHPARQSRRLSAARSATSRASSSGAQKYTMNARFNGSRLPSSRSTSCRARTPCRPPAACRRLMAELKSGFRADID